MCFCYSRCFFITHSRVHPPPAGPFPEAPQPTGNLRGRPSPIDCRAVNLGMTMAMIFGAPSFESPAAASTGCRPARVRTRRPHAVSRISFFADIAHVPFNPIPRRLLLLIFFGTKRSSALTKPVPVHPSADRTRNLDNSLLWSGGRGIARDGDMSSLRPPLFLISPFSF